MHLMAPLGAFFCECGGLDCDERVALTAREYDRYEPIRAEACKFSPQPLSSSRGGADWGADCDRRPPHF
jgi:hypothetical protein